MNVSAAINSLNVASRAVESAAKNIQAPDGSTRVDTLMQNNGISGPSVITRRVEDQYLQLQTMGAVAVAGYDAAIFDYSSKLNTILGPQDQNNPQSMSNQLRNFLSSFDQPLATPQEQRANILSMANNFTSQIRSYVGGIESTKSSLETDLTNSVAKFNNITKQLFHINQNIGENCNISSGNISSLLDQRDSLLSELSSLMAIQYSFDQNGIVTVNAAVSAGSKGAWVSNYGYMQLSYSPDLDLFNHSDSSDVMRLNYYNQNNDLKGTAEMQVNSVVNLLGGRIAGLLYARDNTLPKALNAINDVTRQVAFQIDELQNTGSGFPPASSFTSNKAILRNDTAAFKGQVSFAVVNKAIDQGGKPINDNAGNPLRKVTIDFDKLTGNNGAAGQFSVQNVIDEINAVAAAQSNASVGIGQISTPAGEPNQYLLDQIRLVPTSNVAAGGAMSFQLELSNGSAYDAVVSVTQMNVYDDAGNHLHQANAFVSPPSITVGAGQFTKTGQNIVANLNAAEQFNTIRLTIQVVGSGGQVDTKDVDFIIGTAANVQLGGAEVVNQRSEAVVPANVNAAVPGVNPARPVLAPGHEAAVLTNAKTGGPIFTASFVDANGIPVADPNAAGYLKISTGNGLGLVINSATSKVLPTNATATTIAENFGHWFGLNNFFAADEANPASDIEVNPLISANPQMISLGKAKEQTVSKSVMQGQTLPSATLDLAAGNAADGNTVTIGRTVFTFRNAPAANTPTDVQIGGAAADTIQNLYAAINNYAALQGVVRVTAPSAGATNLNVVARDADANIAVGYAGLALANGWKVSAAVAGGQLGPVVNQLLGPYASATLNCNGNAPGNGNTVTVNGVVFTFGAGAGQIALGANVNAAIQNLAVALNESTDPRIAGLFKFTIDPNHPAQLIATATHVGSVGNLSINSNIAGAGNLWIAPAAAGAAATLALVGGNDYQTNANVNTHALEIGPNMSDVFQNISRTSLSFSLPNSISQQTIDSFFNSRFTKIVDADYQKTKIDNDTSQTTMETLQLEFANETLMTSETRDAAYLTCLDFLQFKQLIAQVVSEVLRNQREILRTLGN